MVLRNMLAQPKRACVESLVLFLVAVAFTILSSKRILISQEIPPEKDIMDVRCHQMPSSVSIAKSGWNLERVELIN